LSVVLLAAVCAGTAAAQAPDGAASVAALDRFIAEVHSLKADFSQELWAADDRLLESASGTLVLQRPNRFVWSYEQPIEQRVIADGMQLWMYDVDLAQVTVAPVDITAPSSPAMLLSGDRSVRDAFTVEETYTADGLEWIRLQPKTGGTDFSSVLLGFDGSAPQRLELVDGLNQVTRIAFANVELNPALDPHTFEFEPPPGVDVIGSGD
jgi:outer membrane lipoprotein carrier protein